MITGIDVKQRIEFSFKSDITEPKTVLILKPQSGLDAMRNKSSDSKENMKNFLNDSIVEIKNCNINKDDFVSRLNMEDLTELLNFVSEINTFNGEDKKKI